MAVPLERGRVIHRLLQLLPGTDRSESRQACGADGILDRIAPRLARCRTRGQILETVRGKFLENKAFSACFAPGSQAEVSLMGTLDRLPAASGPSPPGWTAFAVTGDRVLIVDYKTNRPPVRER